MVNAHAHSAVFVFLVFYCDVRLFIAIVFCFAVVNGIHEVSSISLKSVRIFIMLINKLSLKFTQNARDCISESSDFQNSLGEHSPGPP